MPLIGRPLALIGGCGERNAVELRDTLGGAKCGSLFWFWPASASSRGPFCLPQTWCGSEQLGSGLSLDSFELVHSAPTGDSYGCEQALFARLARRRLVDTKEFFLLDVDEVCCVVQAAAMPSGTRGLDCVGEAAEDRYQSTIYQLRHAATFVAAIPDRASEHHGWVLALRNDCHAEHIVRLMHVETDPYR